MILIFVQYLLYIFVLSFYIDFLLFTVCLSHIFLWSFLVPLHFNNQNVPHFQVCFCHHLCQFILLDLPLSLSTKGKINEKKNGKFIMCTDSWHVGYWNWWRYKHILCSTFDAFSQAINFSVFYIIFCSQFIFLINVNANANCLLCLICNFPNKNADTNLVLGITAVTMHP